MKHSKKRGHDSEEPLGVEDSAEPAADGDSAPPEIDVSEEETASPASDAPDETGVQAESEKFLRLAAEYDNYRKRTAKERLEAGGRAQAELVRRLTDALDDLARFAHVDPASTDATTLVQGVEMVEKKLLRELGALGLEVINPVDQPFDPAVHEAVATEPTPAKEDDHMVARVYQPGYLFQSQLIRPARVVVKQWNG
ncbi:MAG: nucleotide exchange factor GrpE [Gemmatimonadaceae bacterium]|nr:nucleotide exchange factor GrpE [Gemmatimonadaceae bacterium]